MEKCHRRSNSPKGWNAHCSLISRGNSSPKTNSPKNFAHPLPIREIIYLNHRRGGAHARALSCALSCALSGALSCAKKFVACALSCALSCALFCAFLVRFLCVSDAFWVFLGYFWGIFYFKQSAVQHASSQPIRWILQNRSKQNLSSNLYVKRTAVLRLGWRLTFDKAETIFIWAFIQ